MKASMTGVAYTLRRVRFSSRTKSVLYYGGSDGLHTSWRNGFFCLATLRPDGFAGYRATDAAGPANGNDNARL